MRDVQTKPSNDVSVWSLASSTWPQNQASNPKHGVREQTGPKKS